MSAEKFLSPRLKLIAALAESADRLLDIGTDHGYVPISLAEQNKISFAVASDVNRGPVERAAANAMKFGVADKVEVRLGSGFRTVDAEEIDTAVIAGMGGLLINEILADGEKDGKLEFCRTLILQPMLAAYEVRSFLHKIGYHLHNEVLCREGRKLYSVMVAKRGLVPVYDEFEYYFPPMLKLDPLGTAYAEYHLRLNEKIRAGMLKAQGEQDIMQIDMLIAGYNRVLEEIR